MQNRVIDLRSVDRQLRGDGEPPDNDAMTARISKLEEAIANLPTKVDMAELRADIAKGQADMHKAIADNHRWTHGALIGIATVGVIGVIGVIGTIWNAGKPGAPTAAPAAQPPIVITIPQGYERGNAAPAPSPSKP